MEGILSGLRNPALSLLVLLRAENFLLIVVFVTYGWLLRGRNSADQKRRGRVNDLMGYASLDQLLDSHAENNFRTNAARNYTAALLVLQSNTQD